jgi:hypothetical protein
MLRNNSEFQAKLNKNIPQGLKPVTSYQAFAARLKSCPDASCFPVCIFPQAVKSCPDTKQDYETLSQSLLEEMPNG